MKNKLLTGLLSLGLLLPLGVNAETLNSVEEGSNTTNATVTVGEVETPVYDVQIYWDSLKFDWKYNYETNEYEWMPQYTMSNCQSLTLYSGFDEATFNGEKANIYTNASCTTKIDNSTTYETVSENLNKYYVSTGGINPIIEYQNEIKIYDYSTGSEIIPSIKWNSDNNYDHVEGHFQYLSFKEICTPVSEELFNSIVNSNSSYHGLYTDSSCTEVLDESVTEYSKEYHFLLGDAPAFHELLTSEIGEEGRIPENDFGASYELKLFLSNKTKPTTTPRVGDTIGTVTITIKAAE